LNVLDIHKKFIHTDEGKSYPIIYKNGRFAKKIPNKTLLKEKIGYMSKTKQTQNDVLIILPYKSGKFWIIKVCF